jgi:glycosyltransferase involved in cell wall biosynthesis
LRLATVTHFFPSHGGGIELVAGELVRRFCDAGVSVEWVASDTDPPPPSSPGQKMVPVSGTNLIERITQLPYPLWYPSAVVALVRAVRRADVVHVHEHFYFGSALGVVIARLCRRPVVITQHMGALDLGARSLSRLFAWYSRMLGRILFAAATRVVFISANVRGFFRLENAPKASLIFNGVEATLFSSAAPPDARQLRADLGLPDSRRIILFVGRFVRKKGMRALHALIPRFPEVSWVFIGSGPEDPASGSLDNVRVVGRVDHDMLPRYYHAADLLILPSAGEGMPLVVQEALACGLAVLSTDEVASACPDACSMIRSLPSPRSEQDLSAWEQALRATLEDSSYLNDRLARAAAAQQLWSWSRCACAYLQLFERLSSQVGGAG